MDNVTNTSTRGLPSAPGDEQSALATLFKVATGNSAAFKPNEKMVVPPPLLPPPPPPPPAGSALDEAEQLSAHWGDWGMHEGVSFNDPPSSLPQDARDTIKYFGDNSVLYQSIIKDAGGSGNTLTKAALDQFIKDAKGDAKLADDTLPSGTSDSTLKALGAIVANWHAWGLHSGDTPFSNPPPDNLPPDAKAALGTITSDPYLLSQIGNHTGSGAITQQNVADFLKKASDNPVLLNQPAQDTHVQGWLDSLGDAVSPDDKKALAQTGNDAQTLLNFFNAYPRGASELNSEVPPDVADAEKRLLSVDSIKKQLTTSDGTVTRDTVGAFLGNLDKSADAAKDSWGSFQKSEPNADPTVTRMAADASILQADSPILDEAGPGSQLDGEASTQDLQAAGSVGNASLPSALKNAAALFSSPGMFSNLDMAGDNPATSQPDGLMDVKNLGNFISQEVSKMTPASLMATLDQAADRSMTAGVDISKLGPDVFKNPQNYSGAQKAAVMENLESLYTKVSAGIQGGDWNRQNIMAHQGNGNGLVNPQGNLNPNANKILDDIKGKVDQLSQDSDVQTFLSTNKGSALQSIAQADPSFKSALQGYFDGAMKSGDALKTAMAGKDADGKPLSVEDGVQSFITQATTLSQALGTDGKAEEGLNIEDIAQKSGQQGAIKQAYETDILSGKELKDAIANGTDLNTAIQQFSKDAVNLGAALPSDYVSQTMPQLQQTFSETAADAVLGSATTQDMNVAFADKDGNLDTQKLNEVVDNLQKQDPDAFKDSAGQQIKPDQIVNAISQIFGMVRNNVKLDDAMSKFPADSIFNGPKPTGPLADAYKKGALHLVASVLTGGVLAAKTAESHGSPTATAASVGAGAQVAGSLLESYAKYSKDQKPTWNPIPKEQLPTLENAGKLLGGAGNAIGGALSIFSAVQDFKNGDAADGAGSLVGGVGSSLAAIAGLTEGGVGLAGALGASIPEAVTGALGAASAGLGWASAGIGLLATLALSIYEGIEKDKATDAFSGQVAPGFTQWGITGGPVDDHDIQVALQQGWIPRPVGR